MKIRTLALRGTAAGVVAAATAGSPAPRQNGVALDLMFFTSKGVAGT